MITRVFAEPNIRKNKFYLTKPRCGRRGKRNRAVRFMCLRKQQWSSVEA